MIGHRRGVLQRAAVLQVGRDPVRAESVVADPRADPDRLGAAPHHGVGVGLGSAVRVSRPGRGRSSGTAAEEVYS